MTNWQQKNGFKKLNSAKAHDNFYICEKCIGYEIVFKLLRWDNSYRNFHCIWWTSEGENLGAKVQSQQYCRLQWDMLFYLKYSWCTVSCFRCEAQWFSYTCTHVHAFSDSPLLCGLLVNVEYKFPCAIEEVLVGDLFYIYFWF